MQACITCLSAGASPSTPSWGKRGKPGCPTALPSAWNKSATTPQYRLFTWRGQVSRVVLHYQGPGSLLLLSRCCTHILQPWSSLGAQSPQHEMRSVPTRLCRGTLTTFLSQEHDASYNRTRGHVEPPKCHNLLLSTTAHLATQALHLGVQRSKHKGRGFLEALEQPDKYSTS